MQTKALIKTKSITRLDGTTEPLRVTRARNALKKLSSAERSALFRELGLCGCATLSAFTKDEPGASIGMVLGAIIGRLAAPGKPRGSGGGPFGGQGSFGAGKGGGK